jgi:hypothetical protein
VFQVTVNEKFEVAQGQENLADNTGRLAEQYIMEEVRTPSSRTASLTLVEREDGGGERSWLG